MKLQNQNTNIYKNEIKYCNKYKTDLQNYLLQHDIQNLIRKLVYKNIYVKITKKELRILCRIPSCNFLKMGV